MEEEAAGEIQPWEEGPCRRMEGSQTEDRCGEGSQQRRQERQVVEVEGGVSQGE